MDDEKVESQDLLETTEDTTTSETTVDAEEGSADEDSAATIAELKTKNAQLFERAKKAEGFVKQADGSWVKPQKTAPALKPAAETAQTGLTREEGFLIAKGLSLEELDYANKIAKVENIDVLKAADTDLFKTWKSNRDTEAKKAQAQLGTSKGAKSSQKKTFDTPGLSDEDHKALFKEAIG